MKRNLLVALGLALLAPAGARCQSGAEAEMRGKSRGRYGLPFPGLEEKARSIEVPPVVEVQAAPGTLAEALEQLDRAVRRLDGALAAQATASDAPEQVSKDEELLNKGVVTPDAARQEVAAALQNLKGLVSAMNRAGSSLCPQSSRSSSGGSSNVFKDRYPKSNAPDQKINAGSGMPGKGGRP